MHIYLRLKESLALMLVEGFPIILGLGLTVIGEKLAQAQRVSRASFVQVGVSAVLLR